MGKISLSSGAGSGGLGLILAGAAEVIGARTDQDWLRYIGWAGMVLGLVTIIASVRWNDREWWKRRPKEALTTIAAPLRLNNSSTAVFRRYDDEHRGSAVTNSYRASDCRIDLMEASLYWPPPKRFPRRMVEFAQSIPEDQRENWLTTQAASEEVTRLISSAIQSGELPVWVAPNDGDEKLVDPGAIIEMDHASVVSGVYRPPNDRGWLYGRPLFVKKTDWIEFVASVQAMKGAPKRWRKKKRRKTMSAGFAGILAARNGSCAEKP